MNSDTQLKPQTPEESRLLASVNRRHFLRTAGVAMTTGAIIIACKDDEVDPTNGGDPVVDLGSGDIGILNYAYALEQLEAAFYEKVVSSFYTGISDKEKRFLTEIRDHEVIHREFFKAAIPAANRIGGLMVDFSKIDFTSRASVLGTAKVFEDTGVTAYNGAGRFLKSGDYLLLAGKIVSVEARHAAIIRDLLNPNSGDFAGDDVLTSDGFDKVASFAAVLSGVAPFLKTKVTGSNLPK